MTIQENISDHITYKEATKSITAKRLGIDNSPNKRQLTNMRILAISIFEPIRLILGNYPIGIASFFRIFQLNKIIGGAQNSQHMAENESAAMDLDVDNSEYLHNYQVFYAIKDHCDFDQLIWEFGDKYNPDWVHVSYNNIKNRKQILKAVKIKGKIKYKSWV